MSRNRDDKFIYSIESTGALHPEDIVAESINIVTNKAELTVRGAENEVILVLCYN